MKWEKCYFCVFNISSKANHHIYAWIKMTDNTLETIDATVFEY